MPKKVKSSEPTATDTARRLRALRLRAQFSMRELARRAGVAVSYVSSVEAGRLSPTLATLRKLLIALGSDIGPFFSDDHAPASGHVFRRHQMRSVSDTGRNYTFVLPSRPDIRLEIRDEELFIGEEPDYESPVDDLSGYVLQGKLLLDVKGSKPEVLDSGDAFHIPAGVAVRGRCAEGKSVRLISIELLPKVRSRRAAKQ